MKNILRFIKIDSRSDEILYFYYAENKFFFLIPWHNFDVDPL